MPYSERVDLYRQIEQLREKPLITYITSSRPGGEGIMAPDAIPEICKQLLQIPDETESIDFLVVSRGGDPIVSWRIMSLLRERFTQISILLPYEAYSAATLLALGADEIIMHPFSNLGPVDPQLGGKPEPGKIPSQFGAQDLTHFFDFVRNDVGVSDQEQMERAFELVCKEIGAIPIGIAKRSSNLSLSLGEKLLSLHMDDHNKVKAISESLNKSFHHHGYPVGRKEAKEIGLQITDAEEPLEDLIWEVWSDTEKEMKCQEPFKPLEIVMQDPIVSQQLLAIHQLPIPSNIPPQFAGPIIQQLMQQIQPIAVPSIQYDLIHATIESSRIKSEFKTKLRLSAVRMPDLNININVTPISEGWITADTLGVVQ